MPRILSYTPSWLSRSQPGYELFSSSKTTPAGKRAAGALSKGIAKGRPQRTIAYRGSEIFVATDSEIRWSDLVLLSESNRPLDFGRSSSIHSRSRSRDNSVTAPNDSSYVRTLRLPFSGNVTELAISPHNDYMAITTSHTVHIAILPDSSHLGTPDTTPLKLKTFQLGPTAHVLEQSPVASIKWHPLGVQGKCLVTITEDGSIRMWELDKDDRSSFSEPTLAINLQKLANATSADADLRASVYGSGKAFSPDMAELQVAAACFGSPSKSRAACDWSSMTLWIATTGGDVYALCPLLPKRWQVEVPLSQTDPFGELGAGIAAKCHLSTRNSSDANPKRAEAQRKWLTEVTSQIPTSLGGESLARPAEVYQRPTKTPAIPRLQGPFEIMPEIEIEGEADVCDIFVTPLKETKEDLLKEDEDEFDSEDEDVEGSLILLSTTSGIVHCCLDLNGVEAQWLPSRTDTRTIEEGDDLALLVVDSIALPKGHGENVWIPFTPDVRSQHAVFVTHQQGVYYISLSKWIEKVSTELSVAEREGAEFRMDVLLEGSRTLSESIIQLPVAEQHSEQVSCCIVLEDSDIGYFVLFSADHQPFAATLDIPEYELHSESRMIEWSQMCEEPLMPTSEPRLPYQPPVAFWKESELVKYYGKTVPTRQKRAFAEEIKLAPASLDVLTGLHRLLSAETHQLGIAAADLFRRCERLQDEFKDQLRRVSELAHRIDQVTGEDEGQDLVVDGNTKVEKRLSEVNARQEQLSARYQAIKSKLSRAGGREMSTAERSFAEEVEELNSSLNPDSQADSQSGDMPVWRRLEQLRRLQEGLRSDAKDIISKKEASAPVAQDNIPSPLKKQKVNQVMEMLERESALVEATANRLSRLSMQSL
ncbi:hypothetical protein EJ05DRAFT_476930 [Pseudovirgaria hyperparasitica]|uniref:Nuclear pore complex protein An-Nup82 n=1 Tax=Pseudovirgaria hyperparasitica TaxID=470096 RepID=A0A6A6W808_9PEZI|nr:uncharacterized protein EJ05DRAFT_476930 [Pseudovirgaria hyperparasitica]KAF2757717.1 hypothetical protein EJ05DRAFT_476930 [Pseudovirgaria hyperparasitica]